MTCDPVNSMLPSDQVDQVMQFLRDVQEQYQQCMPPGFGFILFIYSPSTPENPAHEIFYNSSANREHVIHYLKEFIRKQEVH